MTTQETPDGSCAHMACACRDASYERDGERYCGASCARQREKGAKAERCRCGHPPCADQAA